MLKLGSRTSDDEIRMTATWNSHMGPFNSLAFEFPWLVSSSSDGRLSLINVRKLLQCSRADQSMTCTVEPPQRMLHSSGGDLFSVAVGADRILSGGDKGMVRVWNFSQTLEMGKRAQALRGIRLEHRMRRRKVQIEINGKIGRRDQSLALPKKNGIWSGKQGDGKS